MYSKTEYTYDKNGNQIMFIRYDWNSATNDWLKSSKYQFIFNLQYSLTNLIMPVDKYAGTSMLTKSIIYDWFGTNWIEKEVSTYYWSAKEVTIDKKK